MTIQNPHDKTFRSIFATKEYAADCIKVALPREIMESLDLDSLTSESETFIDEELKEYQTDLLFSLTTKRQLPLKIYLLFEHKAYPDKKIQVQLLSYLARIYSTMPQLVPVIPLVFYHGKSKWQIPRDFASSFDLARSDRGLYQKYLPAFQYELLDLQSTDLDGMIISLTLKAILYTFQNIWQIDDVEHLTKWMSLLKDLSQITTATALIERLLLYIYSVKEIKPETIAEAALHLQAPDLKEIVMTTAEILIQQGAREKARQAARQMKARNYKLSDIVEITGLSPEEIEKL